ncbi:hypothetical protein FS842_006678 [Serendipita sp. 407]|nr:hypothetical protein FRC20_006937 [Serendipita sp. 405]KAG9057430.1 hypothetical protein FS842_006678 [Serendipita sp. 407]
MDAFAGLAWDEPKQTNNTLGAQQKRQLTPSLSSQTNNNMNNNNDMFSRLAAAGQPVRPSSSTSVGLPLGGGGGGGISSNRNTAVSASTSSSSNVDPFNGLFARGGSPNINMSMADRRAHAERERRERERREREKAEAQGAMWDQLDSAFSSTGSNVAGLGLGTASVGTTGLPNVNSRTDSPSPIVLQPRSTSTATPPIGLKTNPGVKQPTSPPGNSDLFWSMHHPNTQGSSSRTTSPAIITQRGPTASSSSTRSSSLHGSDQILGGFTSPTKQNLMTQKLDDWSQLDALAAPKPAPAAPSGPPLDPYDFDFLVDQRPKESPTSYQATPPRSRARTPGDFDFNERHDDGELSEDDILGDLAKPVERSSTPDLVRSPIRGTPTKARIHSASPPPHIIGKIVEMGFTPEQARIALASTDTGTDVEAALESLLAAAGDVTSLDALRPPEPQASPRPVSRTNRTGTPSQSREPQRRESEPRSSAASGSTPSGQFQADKLLAQASEVGFSVFTKATAFWNQGKEAVQKAYEESLRSTNGTPTPADGRPKWMASEGTELFKLGQYGDAESAYTRAITALPSSHILLVSLYTNRAAARLKTGDSGGAVGDCTTGLKLMGITEDLSGLMDLQEETLTFDGVPGRLDLKEQAVKALQRRAGGLEGMERWDRARTDWERLAGLHWFQAQGKVKEEATRSAVRCRSMVNSASKGAMEDTPKPASKPRARPAPRPSRGPSKPSEAALRLKAADAAKEAEDNERIELKDMVDARIQAWKGGKETNVRALIASLETVLWPELGWVKVGMHELVTPSQVKIRYTKAIAKVHPDKLKTGNTTLEQRMMANGVFAGLNEAWGAFKQ